MSNSSNKWLVKDSESKVHGPYEESLVFSLIEKGVLTGGEQVAEYPVGDYHSISQVSVFYDKFLDVWEGEIGQLTEEEKRKALEQAPKAADNTKSVEDEVSIDLTKNFKAEDQSESNFEPKLDNQDAQSISFVDDVSNFDKDGNTYNPSDDSAFGVVKKQGSFKPNTDDDTNFGKTQSREVTNAGYQEHTKVYERVDDRRKKTKVQGDLKTKYVMIFIAIMIGALFYDQHPAEKMREAKQIHLKAIRGGKKFKKLDNKSMLKIKRKVLKKMEQDNFSSYESAMNLLVETIDKHGPDKENLGLLCSVYNELWKYSFRDSRDLAAISKATQRVSRSDVAGVSVSNCRAIQFFLAGNLASAEQVVDTALLNFPNTASFYDMKAEIKYIQGQSTDTLAYYQKAAELWPGWKKPKFWYANHLKKSGKYEEASDIYQGLIDKGEFHSLAAIELAEIEVFRSGNMEFAQDLLNESVGSGVVVPRVWSSKAFYILAVIAEQAGNLDQAIAYAKQSFELDSRNSVAKTYLIRLAGSEVLSELQKTEEELIDNGDLFFRQGNYLASQAEYKAAFELNNKNAIPGIRAAESLWRLNQGDEAIRWLETVVKSNPKNLDARLQIAKYQVERFDFGKASRNLKRAKSLSKSDYRILRGFAHYEAQRNNPVAAIKFAEKSIQLYDADIDSHIILAKVLMKTSAFDQSYKTIARAIGLEPTNVEAQVVYAEVLSQYQGVDSGAKYISNLINTYPNKMEFRLALARIYMLDSQYEQAVMVLKPVTEVRAQYKPAFLLLAKAYLGSQDAQGALGAYLGAASLDPSDAMPLVEIGQMYLQTGKPGKAITQFVRAQKLNPNYPRISFNLGQAYLRMGQAKAALAEAKKERQRNPMLADSYMLAADSYRKLRQYNKAISEYQQAVQRRPQSADIYVKLGICYRLQGNLDVAEQMISTAKSKESGFPEIYRETGAILEKRGKSFEAVEAYRKYLGLKPNAKDAHIVRSRIQLLGG